MLPHLQRQNQPRKTGVQLLQPPCDRQLDDYEAGADAGTCAFSTPAAGHRVRGLLGAARFQAFSITALVHEVSNPRPVDKDRVVRDVVICDGSKIPRRDADTLVEAIVKPTLQIFSGTSDAPMIAQLTAAAGKNVPLTFLGIQAKQTDNGWKATSMIRYAIFEATGTKADKLKT